jgi:acyl-coenzyme A synthetase/AMP-(fatty) acid ligase
MTFLANSMRVHDAPREGQVPVHSGELLSGVHLVDRGDGLFEVWCRGPIASGYLPNEAPENVRFVTAEDGITWWVSGDLVSWTQNKKLVHRGRTDDVVKIRGKLASPSELIHQLLQWPSVTGATVLVGHHGEEPYFVAHVESPGLDGIDRAGLRAHLRETLDSHLVPRKIEVWESFPLNPHGKLDRVRLAERHGID